MQPEGGIHVLGTLVPKCLVMFMLVCIISSTARDADT